MITYQEILEEFQGIVSTDPTHVYQIPEGGRCLYFQNGKPSCIVGHWFDWRDVDMSKVIEGETADELLSRLMDVEEAAYFFIAEIQSVQDSGAPWSDALLRAMERVEAEYREDPNDDGERK